MVRDPDASPEAGQDPEPGEAPPARGESVDYDEWMACRNQARHPSPDIDATVLLTPYPRRRDWSVARHCINRPDGNQDEGEKQYAATAGWTVAWYAVPFALYAAWTLTFDGKAGTACANPVNNACPPARSAALGALLHSVPTIGVAVLVSLLLATLIRLGSGAWRPITAAFAAAVIGAGAVTILYSVLASG
jgi:hypothetical protein